MLPPLPALTEFDLFYQGRDRVAQILANEIANFKSELPGSDEYNLKVLTERFNPFDSSLKNDGDMLASVWFSSSDYPTNKNSSTGTRWESSVKYHIDCYGLGVAEETVTGQMHADEKGAKRAQWCASLVRYILMSGKYAFLQLDPDEPIVFRDRYVMSFEAYQPQQDSRVIEGLHAVRVVMSLNVEEVSHEIQGEGIEFIQTEIKRGVNGEVLAQLDYDFTN